MSNDSTDKKEKLLELMRKAMAQDKDLREKYQMADKFRFIRDRLQALAKQTEDGLTSMVRQTGPQVTQVGEDDVLVYVYLFNAQGLTFQTWQKMVHPSVFYEYSVNRPIYSDKTAIEAFIRSRSSKPQHGYLTVAVKKTDITASGGELKDTIGGALVKVREGALDIKRLLVFTQNENEYVLGEENQLIKKS